MLDVPQQRALVVVPQQMVLYAAQQMVMEALQQQMILCAAQQMVLCAAQQIVLYAAQQMAVMWCQSDYQPHDILLQLRTLSGQEMGVYVLDNISMAGLAIDKRSSES